MPDPDPPDILGPFVLLVAALPDGVPARVRARVWIKRGLRDYGLRVKVIRYPTLSELTAPDADPGGDEPDP